MPARALALLGRLVLSSGDSHGKWIGPLDRIIAAAALSPFVSRTLTSLDVKPNRTDLETLADLIDGGKLKPVVDRTYALDEGAEAIGRHRFVLEGIAPAEVMLTAE